MSTGNDSSGPDHASVRFMATKDRMKLGISRYSPPGPGGAPLTLERLREVMRQSGIAAPLDEETATQALILLEQGKSVERLVIARGTPPRNARDASFTPYGDVLFPVFPGQDFGRLLQAEPAVFGTDVTGQPVAPAKPGPPLEIGLHPEAHVDVDRAGVCRAKTCGLVRIENGLLRLKTVFTLTRDKICIEASLYHKDFFGEEITPERVVGLLSAMGIVVDPEMEEIDKALAEARRIGGPVKRLPVVLGSPPVHGEDGRLELFVQQRNTVGTRKQNDRIDWRDRGVWPAAQKGTTVARLVPPTPGQPGKNVFGAPVPAQDGKPLGIIAGTGVVELPDPDHEDGAFYKAEDSGLVVFDGKTLFMSELLEIGTDIDYSTGNIRAATGSVKVRGTVRSTFSVTAPESVVVEGSVENSRIEAGGDVQIVGGVLMHGDGSGLIRAGRDFRAAFVNNARIIAGGDVTVEGYITSSSVQSGGGGEGGSGDGLSEVRAGGVIRVKDEKGKVQGGTLVCGGGLETCELGSPMGVRTVVAVSIETEQYLALSREKIALRNENAKIERILGEDLSEPSRVLARIPRKNRPEAEKLMAKHRKNLSVLRTLNNLLAEASRQALEGAGQIRVRVRGRCHAGVTIKMGGTSYRVSHPLEAVQFSWDSQARKILQTTA